MSLGLIWGQSIFIRPSSAESPLEQAKKVEYGLENG